MAINYKHLCPNCFNTNYSGGVCPNCNQSAIETHDGLSLPPGTVLQERYLLGRILGVGGFGITYLAVDLNNGSKCAVKEYYPKTLSVRSANGNVHPSSQANYAAFQHGLSAFADEAGTLSKLLGESLVVQVLAAFNANQTAYFVMEYLDGVNLKALMRSMGGAVTTEHSMLIFKSVAQALSVVHAHGMLHRDVSPENIFITKSGQVKLIDFGATRYFVGEKSQSLSVILKPGFAPPEQYTSKSNQGPWTDIYALAATYYYMVTGVLIPDAPERLAGAKLRPLCELTPQVGTHISSVMDQALNTDYRLRFQTVRALSDALEISARPAALDVARRNVAGNPYFEVVSGRYKGYKWSLPKNMEIRIGRSANESNIILDEPSVSRVHCVLVFNASDGMFLVKDVSSYGCWRSFSSHSRLRTLSAGTVIRVASENVAVKVGLE